MLHSTMSVKTFGGIPVNIPNKITSDKKDFYISYNNVDYRIYGSDTTAIVTTAPESFFYILKGDHTAALNKIETLEEAKAYFNANIDKIAKYSDIPGKEVPLKELLDRSEANARKKKDEAKE